MTPGGGGYGDPFARDPALVAARRAARLLHARGSRGALGRRADARWTDGDGGDARASPEGASRRSRPGEGYGLSGEGVPLTRSTSRLDLSPGRGAMTAYFRPTTLDEALAIRAGRDVEVIAGGTDVYPTKAARAGWGDMAHKDVLDITAIPGLRGIEEADDALAHRRLDDLDGPDPRRLAAAVRRACRRRRGRSAACRSRTAARSSATSAPPRRPATASPTCWRSTPRSSSRACAARASSRSRASSTAIATPPAGRTRSSPRCCIPKPKAAARGAFLKLGARRYLVISIVMAAGVVETDAAGAIDACPHRRRRLLARSRAGCRRSRRALLGRAARAALPDAGASRRISPSLRPSTTSAARAPPIASPPR